LADCAEAQAAKERRLLQAGTLGILEFDYVTRPVAGTILRGPRLVRLRT
jgi:hypothetical protein